MLFTYFSKRNIGKPKVLGQLYRRRVPNLLVQLVASERDYLRFIVIHCVPSLIYPSANPQPSRFLPTSFLVNAVASRPKYSTGLRRSTLSGVFTPSSRTRSPVSKAIVSPSATRLTRRYSGSLAKQRRFLAQEEQQPRSVALTVRIIAWARD